MVGFCMRFCLNLVFLLVISLLLHSQLAVGIRFSIDQEECFSHSVPYEGDILHASFVVIKSDTTWHYGDEGVDLVVKDPSGDQVHVVRDKTSEKFEFAVNKKGLFRFCFTNKSPYHETVDFDVHIGHFTYIDQHAKDEHLAPLLEQIAKLEESLRNIQFEQHWLEAQTDRQALDRVKWLFGYCTIAKLSLELPSEKSFQTSERRDEQEGNPQGDIRISCTSRSKRASSLPPSSPFREKDWYFKGIGFQ